MSKKQHLEQALTYIANMGVIEDNWKDYFLNKLSKELYDVAFVGTYLTQTSLTFEQIQDITKHKTAIFEVAVDGAFCKENLDEISKGWIVKALLNEFVGYTAVSYADILI